MVKSTTIKLIMIVIVLGSFSIVSSNPIDIAFNTSTFEGKSGANKQITSIDNPLAMGFQLKYHVRPEMAVKLANESLKGSIQNIEGEGLNVQTSMSILLYPVQVWRFSPYLNTGLSLSRYHDVRHTESQNDLLLLNGVGTDFSLIGNLLLSTEANFYSDGLNYLGWGTTFSLGYRF